jgi:hypothetical protein
MEARAGYRMGADHHIDGPVRQTLNPASQKEIVQAVELLS